MYVLPITLISFALIQHTVATPAVSTITVSAAPAPTSASYTSGSEFQSDLLLAHNFFRSEHNVSDLTWNSTSAQTAQSWANACVFKHSGGPTGENLAAGYANATAAVDGWGDERTKYDFKKPTGFSEATGHFTQVVWSNTTSVGCARKECNGANETPGWYIVCEYWPHGNVVGDDNQFFKDNVKAQIKGKNTDTVESGVSAGTKGSELRWGVGVVVVAGLTALVV